MLKWVASLPSMDRSMIGSGSQYILVRPIVEFNSEHRFWCPWILLFDYSALFLFDAVDNPRDVVAPFFTGCYPAFLLTAPSPSSLPPSNYRLFVLKSPSIETVHKYKAMHIRHYHSVISAPSKLRTFEACTLIPRGTINQSRAIVSARDGLA